MKGSISVTRWVVLNIILFSVGIALGAMHYPTDFDGLRCTTYEDGSSTLAGCFAFGAFLGVITGLFIGIGQGLYLRRKFGLSSSRFRAWVTATTVAFALGHAIGDSAPVAQILPWSALANGLVSGLIVGTLQWLVLRGTMEQAGHWVWQSTLGFGVGLWLVGIAALFLLDQGSRLSAFGWHTLIDLGIFVVLDGLFVGGIWAYLTGRVLGLLSSSWS
jgi:hypothetical protein